MNAEPIVIVGAGPAGLVLALSLARYEINVYRLYYFQELSLTCAVGDFRERSWGHGRS
jgi:ribulose 1,5-bisphosphate synthetase/thiazole synthase